MTRLLPLALVLLSSSCALMRSQDAVPIAPDAVTRIEVGDPASKVVDLLGAPAAVVELGHRTAYRYEYTQTKRAALFLLVVGLFNTDIHQDRVWVFLDEEDKVTHVGVTLEGDEAEYSMPWSEG